MATYDKFPEQFIDDLGPAKPRGPTVSNLAPAEADSERTARRDAANGTSTHGPTVVDQSNLAALTSTSLTPNILAQAIAAVLGNQYLHHQQVLTPSAYGVSPLSSFIPPISVLPSVQVPMMPYGHIPPALPPFAVPHGLAGSTHPSYAPYYHHRSTLPRTGMRHPSPVETPSRHRRTQHDMDYLQYTPRTPRHHHHQYHGEVDHGTEAGRLTPVQGSSPLYRYRYDSSPPRAASPGPMQVAGEYRADDYQPADRYGVDDYPYVDSDRYPKRRRMY